MSSAQVSNPIPCKVLVMKIISIIFIQLLFASLTQCLDPEEPAGPSEPVLSVLNEPGATGATSVLAGKKPGISATAGAAADSSAPADKMLDESAAAKATADAADATNVPASVKSDAATGTANAASANAATSDAAVGASSTASVPAAEKHVVSGAGAKASADQAVAGDDTEAVGSASAAVAAAKADGIGADAAAGSSSYSVTPCAETEKAKISKIDRSLQHLMAAINDFSSSLIKNLERPHGNIVISPLSIVAALAAAYQQSGGNTRKQIQKVLAFESHKVVEAMGLDNYDLDLRNIFFNLEQMGGVELLFAVRMYMDQSHKVKPSFQHLSLSYSSFKQLDFQDEPQQTMELINQWVANKTDQHITDMLPEAFSPETQLVLVNAVFFNGKFKTPFPKEATKERDFHLPGDIVKKTSMMTLQDQQFEYLDDDKTGFRYLELPYDVDDRHDPVVLLLALPKERVKPPGELDMTAELLCRLSVRMKATTLKEVVIPKLKMEYETTLKEPLASMGVSDLFEEGKSNLTGISEDHKCFVDSMLHKVIVVVNEGLTHDAIIKAKSGASGSAEASKSSRDGQASASASAKSSAHGSAKSSASASTASVSFIADRPFHLYLVEKRFKGLLLFSGKVTNPFH